MDMEAIKDELEWSLENAVWVTKNGDDPAEALKFIIEDLKEIAEEYGVE